MGISLDAHALEQLNGEHKALLDTIDNLRKHGVGQLIDLPQIIVVGDQSSGKSSVLAAISRVHFPVEDGLCTRFATELILRTGPELKVNVQIQPASSTNEEIQSFSQTCSNSDDLPDIIENAKRAMLQDGAGFSEDILRVELSRPDVPNLTIVDLPGFCPFEDGNQSSDDRVVVDRLVESYMAKKNSIILAIVSAQTQLFLQKVLWKVKLHDKENVRTLGIITKPDAVKASQDEKNFISLAQNLEKSHWLSLGWHVLRNRDEDECDTLADERDDREEMFFQAGSWSSVPQENRGIDALRRRLSDILYDHIKTNLPRLVEDIENKIHERQARLTLLGKPRSSPREIRAYLDRIASQFQIVSLQAVDGIYFHEFFGGLYPDTRGMTYKEGRIRKLRPLVRDLNRTFAYVLATKGSTHIILPKGVSVENDAIHQQESPYPGLPSHLHSLVDLYHFEDPERITFDQASELLEMESSANHGTEFLGTSNDRIAVEFFREQSRPWEAIAHAHARIILQILQAFVEELLGHLANADDQTRSAILRDVVDPFFEAKTSAIENKIKELLHHYQHGHPQPLGLEFEMILTSRHRASMDDQVLQGPVAGQPHTITSDLQERPRNKIDPAFRGRFDAKGLVYKAEAYYETSLRTFTENVITLGIENCLIEDLPNVFTTDLVSRMDDNELGQLAAESDAIRAERLTVQEECDSLKKGLQLCNKYHRRQLTLFTELEFPPTKLATARVESQSMLPDRLLQKVAKLQVTSSQPYVDKQTQTLPTASQHYVDKQTQTLPTASQHYVDKQTQTLPTASQHYVDKQTQTLPTASQPYVDKQTQTLPTPQSVRDDTKPTSILSAFSGAVHAHPAATSGQAHTVQCSCGQPLVALSAFGTADNLPVSGNLFGNPAQTQPVSSSPLVREATNVPNSATDGATSNPDSRSGNGLFRGCLNSSASRPVGSANSDASTSTITNETKPLTDWRGPMTEKEPGTENHLHYQHICFYQECRNMSPEELRMRETFPNFMA